MMRSMPALKMPFRPDIRASAAVLPFNRRAEASNRRLPHNEGACAALLERGIEVAPRDAVSRQGDGCDGMAAEIVQATRHERLDIRFQAPVHMLVVVEQGVRVAGETSIEGLPRSALRDLRRKLSFVPAGHAFHEWQQPSALARAMYIYFDPQKLPVDAEPGRSALIAPRLFFEDPALWETALKLARLIENPTLGSRICLEALGVILAHELLRPDLATRRSEPGAARGGLATWQQRLLADYIEENLAERVALSDLAKLVRLSQYHFCRAFKESFGLPPHRYHTSRRIERAKALLAKPGCSVTEISLAVGFSETSSFSAAFRNATGLAPSAYRRSLR